MEVLLWACGLIAVYIILVLTLRYMNVLLSHTWAVFLTGGGGDFEYLKPSNFYAFILL